MPCEHLQSRRRTMARTNTDAHKSIYLTDGSVAALPYARGERGVYVARDTEIIGFRCIVNRSSKRLVYQGELREGGKRHTLYKRLGDPETVMPERPDWRPILTSHLCSR